MAFSLAGTTASGVMSALNNEERQRELKRQRGESNHFFNEQLHQNPLNRYDFAQSLHQLDRDLWKYNSRADAKQRIIGGTPEAATAVRQYNADAYAKTQESILAQQSRKQDYLTAQQRAESRDYDARERAMLDERDKTYANMAFNAANSFQGISDDDFSSDLTTEEREQRRQAREQRRQERNPEKYMSQQIKTIISPATTPTVPQIMVEPPKIRDVAPQQVVADNNYPRMNPYGYYTYLV